MNPERREKNIDINDVYLCLGSILAKVESLNSSMMKMNYALIGLIAAMIGIKVLGTDPLLDIATTIQIIASFLSIGVVILVFKKNKNGTYITSTGWWFLIFIILIVVNTGLVYFSDIMILDPRVVYVNRILFSIALGIFAWKMISNPSLTKKKENTIDSC